LRCVPGDGGAGSHDAETRGNPLALLELSRGLTPAELAGGFGLPGATPLAGRIEDSFARQLADWVVKHFPVDHDLVSELRFSGLDPVRRL
jgi:hypothetical protein